MTSSAGASDPVVPGLDPPNVERIEPQSPSSSLPLSDSNKSSFFLVGLFRDFQFDNFALKINKYNLSLIKL